MRVRTALAAAAIVVTMPVGLVVAPTPAAQPAAGLFTGDYGTGDFSQWQTVQTKSYNGSGTDYTPGYPAAIVRVTPT